MPIINFFKSNSKSLAVIAFLAKHIGNQRLGRTSLMKLLYFIEEWQGVPLGYSFSIYSYGPFDSEVLSDLGQAERTQVVATTLETFSGGYRYNIALGEKVDEAINDERGFIEHHREQLTAVLRHFGGQSPSDLELKSTIHFAFRETSQSGHPTKDALAQTVQRIKPKFDLPYIIKAIESLESIKAIETQP